MRFTSPLYNNPPQDVIDQLKSSLVVIQGFKQPVEVEFPRLRAAFDPPLLSAGV